MNETSPNLESCASEPIRVPGAIQPHGRMLVLAADADDLVAFSANWRDADEARSQLGAFAGSLPALVDGDSPAAVGHATLDGLQHDVSAHRQRA